MLYSFFVEHPRSVGESYVEHMGKALGFGLVMILSGAACVIHGLVPRLFTRTGSATVTRLYDQMVLNRARAESQAGGDTASE